MKAGSTITLPGITVRVEPVMVDTTFDTPYRTWRQVDTLYFVNDVEVTEQEARKAIKRGNRK